VNKNPLGEETQRVISLRDEILFSGHFDAEVKSKPDLISRQETALI
jgi:hypothetical protein